MTETQAQDALAITANTMGHDFLAALLVELRSMPGHWATLNAQKQQEIIDKLKEKIQTGHRKGRPHHVDQRVSCPCKPTSST